MNKTNVDGVGNGMQDRMVPAVGEGIETAACTDNVKSEKAKEAGMKDGNEDTGTQMEPGSTTRAGSLDIVSLDDKPVPLKAITHVALHLGSTCVIPISELVPEDADKLRKLVKSGGGSVLGSDGSYQFCFTSEHSDCCEFSIWKGNVQIIQCFYADSPKHAKQVWEKAIECPQTDPNITKPAEPWLAVCLFPTLYFHPTISISAADIPRLGDFFHAVAETWRRLDRSERSPLKAKILDEYVTEAKSQDVSPAERSSVNDVRQQQTGEDFEQQVKRILQQKCQLEHRIDHLKTANSELTKQLSSTAHIRQEVERLRKDMASKIDQIKVLEAANSELVLGIDHRVDAKVVEMRMKVEDQEFHALLAEEQRDEAMRRCDKAERKLKHFEQVLRKHGWASEIGTAIEEVA